MPDDARSLFNRLVVWARVNLNMPRAELASLTPAETAKYVDEWNKRERREDQRIGRICATLANCHRDSSKKPNPFTEHDFVPRPVRKREPGEDEGEDWGESFRRWADDRIKRQESQHGKT